MTYSKFKYNDGQEMRQGDRVELKRRFKRKEKGIVTFVFDPDREIVPNGNNEFGFAVSLESGVDIWAGGPPGDELVLLERS